MEEALQAGEAALRRDPREAPYGFLAGGEFLHEGAEVFMWFATTDELVTHLLDVEPLLVSSLAHGRDIEAYRERIRPALHGLNEPIRVAFNEAAEGYMLIDWWGHYDDLGAARSPTSRELLAWFRDPGICDMSDLPPLADHEREAFVAFLKAW